MLLKHLTISNFRSYKHLETDIPERILLLSGGNAQGKTSFLEALFYCSTFTSALAGRDRQLIRFDILNEPVAVARIIVIFQIAGAEHKLEVRIIQETEDSGARLRKEILLDGRKTTAQNAVGKFLTVLFIPQMTAILEGSPQERRRYLNITLSQSVPGYAKVLSQYNQIITQRNALLKALAERRADPQQLDYWDTLMAQKGAMLIRQRAHALEALDQYANTAHLQLTNGQEKLRLAYQPALTPDAQSTEAEIADAFLNHLKTNRNVDIARGISTTGPHRDDFRISGNEIDLGVYGSRGQIRTALISLKFAEIEWVRQRTGAMPLLLLDETLAELDNQRRMDLMHWLDNSRQGILTTTDLGYFSPEFLRNHTVWHVANGSIEKQAE